MDNFDLIPETKKKVNRKPLVWNLLTVLALLAACGLAYYFLMVFINPNSALNPLPPAALPTRYQTATVTSTVIPLPPTWTPSATIIPEPSRTKAPTWTLLPEMITPSVTITPTITATEPTPTITTTTMPATAAITYAASTTIHTDQGCTWLGVGGKVVGTDGKPLTFQEIKMGGMLDGKAIDFLTVSGTAQAYGTAGFEFVLSDHTIASTQTLWIQLLDNTATALTNRIFFDTYTDCSKNLVMVVFTKTR